MTRKRCRRIKIAKGTVVTLLWFASLLPAQTGAPVSQQSDESSLKRLSLEELTNIEVISVSRREEPVTQAAAAIAVITQEDIRRSGVRTIADALRLANGLDVARSNGNSWSISSRGFDSSSPNKMQVLLDGRILYSPLFAGTFWDVQGTMLEDIERIEVIRGPGATLWGANAVNGVINIITKTANTTQGGLLVAGGGTETAFGGVRYGGKVGDRGYYRIHSKYDYFGALALRDGSTADDPLQRGFLGFRTDWTLANSDRLTVQGDLYRGNAGRFNQEDVNTRGGNVLGRWTRRFDNGSDLQVLTYYDRTSRGIPPTLFEVRNSYDVELQHGLLVGSRQNVVWGLGYRASADDTRRVPILFFEPENRTLHWFSAFAQDEITLLPDRLELTLGSKFETNSYTGLEVQPTVRLAWNQSVRNLLWGAVSRAVRTPTRLDADLRVDAPGILIIGNPDQQSEELIAYEFGYRYLTNENFTVSVSGYYNQYDHIRSIEEAPRPGESQILGNGLQGHTLGGELGSVVQVRSWWQLRASYAYVSLHLERKEGSRAINEGTSEANDPKHRFSFRSNMNLPHRVELDFWLRSISGRPNPVPVTAARLPGYATFDIRLGWRPLNNLELSIVGQNLPEEQHAEFPAAVQEEIQRGVYGKVVWTF
ncbi:MAG: hypothetical protein A3F68_08580 [Acidobacteria bacterium RIFCSPLOWO2_12_FULL_54_10]|nr:MAG: hypothetical protein A3F68_08580 [Acidobacteria bacterium RIFCSPLOWO2_12_FULL_54_10]